jgi:hypothetical protein
VETRVWVQSPGQTILGGSRGGGQFGTGLNWWIRWEIGVDGGGRRDTNGVGCWLIGWVGVRGGFPFKILYKQFVTKDLVYETVDFGKIGGILGVW